MVNWLQLHRAFNDLHKVTGRDKSSCGMMQVIYEPTVHKLPGEPFIFVEFGGYSMPTMNRHETLGPFLTEEEAYMAACNKICDQYLLVIERFEEYKEDHPSLQDKDIPVIPDFLKEYGA